MKIAPPSPITYFISACILSFCEIVQIFEWYVYEAFPPLNNTLKADLSLSGHEFYHLSSFLMLLSFFALLYPFVVICIHNFTVSPTASMMAFLGLFIFCLFQIYLLSIQVFYIQMGLAWFLMQTNGPGVYEHGVAEHLRYQELRTSLYFPLIFSQLIASVILALTIKVKANRDMLLKYAFGINALYLVWYLIKIYRSLFYFGDFYNGIYSPVTIIVYFLLLIWFVANSRKLNNQCEVRAAIEKLREKENNSENRN
jgi:hypothetical protein